MNAIKPIIQLPPIWWTVTMSHMGIEGQAFTLTRNEITIRLYKPI